MVGAYVQLLKDNEAEVRSAAASQIPGNFVHAWERGLSAHTIF
jgi:hypothetical protein